MNGYVFFRVLVEKFTQEAILQSDYKNIKRIKFSDISREDRRRTIPCNTKKSLTERPSSTQFNTLTKTI